MGREELLERHRAVEGRAAVVDLHHDPQGGEPVPDRVDVGGQRAVEDEHLGVGVLEQIGELVLEVPVVHVHVHRPGLQRPVHGLQELVAVVQVERDFRARLDAVRGESRREPRRSLVEGLPRVSPVALHDRGAVRQGVTHRFEDGR